MRGTAHRRPLPALFAFAPFSLAPVTAEALVLSPAAPDAAGLRIGRRRIWN